LVIRVCFKPQVLKKTMALSPQGTWRSQWKSQFQLITKSIWTFAIM
jgi:hypothetical protein